MKFFRLKLSSVLQELRVAHNGRHYIFKKDAVTDVPDDAIEHVIKGSHVTATEPDEQGVITDFPQIEQAVPDEVVAPPTDDQMIALNATTLIVPEVPPVPEVPDVPPVPEAAPHDAQ